MTAYGTGRTPHDKADIPAGVSRRSSVLFGAAGALTLGADASRGICKPIGGSSRPAQMTGLLNV